MMGLFFAYIRTVFSWFWEQITIYLPVFSRKRETSLDSAAAVSKSAETSVQDDCNISDEKESPTLQEEVVEVDMEKLSKLEEGEIDLREEIADFKKGFEMLKYYLIRNGKLEGPPFSAEGESHVGELDVIEAGAPVPPPDHVKESTTATTAVYGAEKAETILGKNVSEEHFSSQKEGRSVN
jgi:hypothetical protein